MRSWYRPTPEDPYANLRMPKPFEPDKVLAEKARLSQKYSDWVVNNTYAPIQGLTQEARRKQFFDSEGLEYSLGITTPDNNGEIKTTVQYKPKPATVYNENDEDMPEAPLPMEYEYEDVYIEVPDEEMPQVPAEDEQMPQVRKTKKIKVRRRKPGLYTKHSELVLDAKKGYVRYELQPFDMFWDNLFKTTPFTKSIFGVQYNRNYKPWVNLWDGKQFLW